MKSLYTALTLLIVLLCGANANAFSVTGKVTNAKDGAAIPAVTVTIPHGGHRAVSDKNGRYILNDVKPGRYTITFTAVAFHEEKKEIEVNGDLVLDVQMNSDARQLQTVEVKAGKDGTSGFTRLKDVEGTAIYAGKKSEVVVLNDVTANKATNNSRQIYAKVAGLNIWENDGAGIQLGIGGRGLNPNRVTNFNTRQNGYDMSADALGYPESYYSPATEAVDRIEIVRGAASLQYGTQFGGLVNFKINQGPEDKKFEFTTRNTGGSWGFFNTFNSIGGTYKKLNYYAYYQHKSGDGWRPNSEFNVNTAYAGASYQVNSKMTVTLQYTFMDYLAHQPGGLTDKMFAEDPHQSIRERNWFKVNWNLGAAIFDYKISNKLKFNSRFFGLAASRSALGILTYINRADPGGDRDLWTDNYRNWGNESRLLYSYNLGKNPSTLLVGMRYYEGHTQREQGLGNSGSGGSKSDFMFNNPDSLEYSKYTFPNHNLSFFAENIFRLSPKWSVVPGVRFEKIITEADGFYNTVNKDLAGNIIYSQRNDDYRKNSRAFILGGLGVNYNAQEHVQFYANFSQNYRAINFSDMRVVNPNLQVDPNLKDEKGYSADLGVRGRIKDILNYDVNLFLINYDNKIGTVLRVDSSSFNIYNYRTNVSQSRHLGMESFVEADIWRLIKGSKAKMSVTVFSNLSLINARYINSKDPAVEGKKVELAPDIIFKTGVAVKVGKVRASYQFSYTSDQYTDATNAVYTTNAINGLVPSYTIMDLSAEYIINKNFAVSGTINNLTNQMYFTRRADSYPGPGIIPSDARSFYLTAQFKIGK